MTHYGLLSISRLVHPFHYLDLALRKLACKEPRGSHSEAEGD